MYPIIFLWSHPRSMSTAIERIMRERGDLECLHEPFLHYYYLHRTEKSLPHFDIEHDHPSDYESTRDWIVRLAQNKPVFAKDMSYYVMPELLQDTEFCRRIRHCFLIRNPFKSILSYYHLDPDLSQDEIGIEAQWLHYKAVRNMEQLPVVIEAETVQADTRGTMKLFWQALDLEYLEEALNWKSESAPSDWQYVKGWHAQVSNSSGIRPAREKDETEAREKFNDAVRQAPRLKQYLDHHWPSYLELQKLSLTTEPE